MYGPKTKIFRNKNACEKKKKKKTKKNIIQNVIYLVTCTKCSVQYEGSTSNEFKVRFRNHKSAMKTNKYTCEVATHFNKSILSDFRSPTQAIYIYIPISTHERNIIIHAKRSLLFSDNTPWEKKASNDRFDVTMGSFDGAETCELVGCYILSRLTQKY